jgi:hypothetical protein
MAELLQHRWCWIVLILNNPSCCLSGNLFCVTHLPSSSIPQYRLSVRRVDVESAARRSHAALAALPERGVPHVLTQQGLDRTCSTIACDLASCQLQISEVELRQSKTEASSET